METIAVYWEPKIRTYGLNLLEGLTLYRLTLPLEQVGPWGKALQDPSDSPTAFRLVWHQADAADLIGFWIVCDSAHAENIRSVLNQPLVLSGTTTQTPVDIIFFQGPHFGDRYGILDFTYQALQHGQIPLAGTVCSGATIYLVVPAGSGRAAQQLLAQAFEIPMSVERKGKAGANGGVQP